MTLVKRSAAGRIDAVLPATPLTTHAASLVASAREAYLRGDFSACVAALEGKTFAEETIGTEALFIFARSLLRLQQFRRVIALLEPMLGTFPTLDESCTARMLHGYAVAIGQDVDQGLKLLGAAALFADSPHVHRSVRAELAYYRGIAHWSKREFSESSRLAMEAEGAELDVLSVRATQLRAFIAAAQTEYVQALRLFERARQAYALCRGRDVALATQIICHISTLEMNLRSASIRGSHREPNSRTIPGTSFGPAIATSNRMAMVSADAWLYALDGDCSIAIRKSLEAVNGAPTSAWRVWALAAGATLSQAVNDSAHARCLAEEAAELAMTIDWNTTADEERVGLLWLAEVCAVVKPSAAADIVGRYDSVTSLMDPTRTLRDANADPRLAAWEAYVRGLVARVVGNDGQAADMFRRSADLFSSCGHLWRAALALIELDSTPVDTTAENPLERAAMIVRDNFPESFLAARLRWARVYIDPAGRRLTPAQVEVLRSLLGNKTPKVIAAESDRSMSTVRKHIEAVQAAFGTHSIVELMLACARRGMAS